MIPPMLINYHAGPQQRRNQPMFSAIVGLICGCIMAGVIAAGALIVGQFTEIYRDFNVQLPLITQWLVSANRVLRQLYFTPLILLPVFFGFALPLVDLLFPLPPTRRRLLRGGAGLLLVYVLFIALIIAIIFALFLPMISLIEGMSGAGNGKP